MSEKILVTLKVNDEERCLAVSPNLSLKDLIRDELGLTGTKGGCEAGDCGACTVLLNGRPVNSCLVLAVQADGQEVQTIEGLGENGDLHPLQKSFIHHGALQCGFCTPGMIMAAKALIDRKPEPTEAEILSALGGNLCRCGTYPRIIAAIQDWKSGGETVIDGHRLQDRDHSSVGIGVRRSDAPDKVSGRAKYTADLRLPGMLYGKILGSTVAHGKILSIDTERAEAMPGVLAVITGKDVPDIPYGVSPARYDEHILAKERVRYVGDEVAAVVAVDEASAEAALLEIEVLYEELPAVFDAEEAIADGAVQIHPEDSRFENNINTAVNWHFGDVEKGFEEADHIREQRFVGNRPYQSPIEPHAAIARWEHPGDRLSVWMSAQAPHYTHHMLSRVFDLPQGNIRMIKPAVGGGFGVKAETTPLEFCSVIFAKMTGRPVMMKYSREEMFRHFRGRHKQTMDLKIGVKKDGQICAVQSRILLNGGAYTSYGIVTAYYAGSMTPTLYKIPNYRYDGYRLYTNLPACGAMRGHGVPQPRFAFESLLDMIAEDLGIDPVEIRLRNAMTPDSSTCNDLDISSCEFTATLEKARKLTGWSGKYGKLPAGKGIGIGSGGFVSGAGYPIYRSDFPHSNAVIRVHEDGMAVSLHIATAEIGQGCDTVLPQIAAEELGIPYERVWMLESDSVQGPLDLGSYASRVTLMGGNAVKMAASVIKEQILEEAARILDCMSGDLKARDGKIFRTGVESPELDWDEVARKLFSKEGPIIGKGHYSPPPGLGGNYKGAAVGTSPAYSFSTAIAEVSVDLETGLVTVDHFTDVSDAGTVINPTTFHGQVEGAAIMGMGEALMEDTLFDDQGRMINPDLHGYLLPSIADTPKIDSQVVESYEPLGPFGAKEIGEGCIVPMMGAIANAIHDACGVRITELPITPEKILAGLKKKEQE
ncbi:MAG: molybdopterin-dependent oxidoreductase [Candidatus Krumholzibacteria bacterium]|jgi:4-hydroxybenzoyl-CoA reductase subunit alpha|nr:molybdopterin-dependent oxidoreductase [Candidatus Krumholzibacteria bacterium]MDP6668432.1 molybdopterin-dependent oxidoreductase [Candidatus Krumholzibacteria bacterium]MDP6797253.1 molybdopterin-dependent oxidoreductase [Candidatus Krumholzibacteria bacterium]